MCACACLGAREGERKRGRNLNSQIKCTSYLKSFLLDDPPNLDKSLQETKSSTSREKETISFIFELCGEPAASARWFGQINAPNFPKQHPKRSPN